MIDLHAHILPGVDDGAQDIDTAVEMAKLAVESGVTRLCATPHSSAHGRIQNHYDEKYLLVLKTFQNELKRQKIDLKVCAGMEIFGTMDIVPLLEKKELICLNHSRYPLVEFPFSDHEIEATEILSQIIDLGMIPIVAHPERYEYVQQDPSLLNAWMKMGCLFQINRGSFMGRFGQRSEKLAFEMLERGFVCLVASDAHNPTIRSTWMKDVYDLICQKHSEELARDVLCRHPEMILDDKIVLMKEPDWFKYEK